MCVPQHQQVQLLPLGQQALRILALRGGRPLHRIPVPVARQQGSEPPHQCVTDVGVQRAEQLRREWPAGNPVQQTGSQLAADYSVSMRYQGPQAGQLEFDGPRVELCAELFAPKRAAPAVVVAARERELDAGPPHCRERVQGGECRARYDGLVLEPELEEIPVYHQLITQVRHRPQKAVKRLGRLGRGCAQVGVGEHDCGI